MTSPHPSDHVFDIRISKVKLFLDLSLDRIRRACESLRAVLSLLRSYALTWLTPTFGEQRGEIASWVVVTALVVAAAVVIVGIVTTKLTSTANNIQTP